MKAAVLFETGAPFQIEEVSLDAPRAGEVLVRLAAAGVCRSDHHVQTGVTPHPMPVVCGHEGSGVVEAVGADVSRVRPGDHVVLSWAPSCGACSFCSIGLPAQCEAYRDAIWEGRMLDGATRLSLPGSGGRSVHRYATLAAFAEATVVPASCCVPIRKDVSLEAAALVGCAVATGVCAALRRARVSEGSSAAVFGCGGVGMSIVQGAALAGAGRIIAVDVSRGRLDRAAGFGATDTVDASAADPVEAIRTLTGGRGADYSFEAIGRPETMTRAIESARPGGTIVLVGLGSRTEVVTLGAGTFTRSDKVLASAYYGGCIPDRDMPMILDHYVAGRIKLDEMVGRRRPLSEINEAMADLSSGDLLRTVIVF